MKCPQLSKPEATAARNQNSIGDRTEKKTLGETSLDGIGSNMHVVGLDDLTSLYNSSSPIVENEWNCSSGDL